MIALLSQCLVDTTSNRDSSLRITFQLHRCWLPGLRTCSTNEMNYQDSHLENQEIPRMFSSFTLSNIIFVLIICVGETIRRVDDRCGIKRTNSSTASEL